jgi:hypothetical protein
LIQQLQASLLALTRNVLQGKQPYLMGSPPKCKHTKQQHDQTDITKINQLSPLYSSLSFLPTHLQITL